MDSSNEEKVLENQRRQEFEKDIEEALRPIQHTQDVHMSQETQMSQLVTQTEGTSVHKSIINTPTSTPRKPTGSHIGVFTAVTPEIQKVVDYSINPSITEQNESTARVPIKTMEKKVITCRFKLKIVKNACNLPLLAKQMVKLYRDADVSLNIIPFTILPSVLPTGVDCTHTSQFLI